MTRLGASRLASLVLAATAGLAPSGASAATDHAAAAAPASAGTDGHPGSSTKGRHVGRWRTGVMPVDPANPANPLAGHPWGVYHGKQEPSWEPYVHAHGRDRARLAHIALAPKSKWFGAFIPDGKVHDKVRDYLRSATHGSADVVAPMTLARMQPWEGAACHRLPTRAERRSYTRYVHTFATSLHDARVSVVITPDGPFAGCAPHHSSLPSRQVAASVHAVASDPNATAYIEMGSADWFRGDPRQAVRLLLADGVAHARGFALDTSHFDSTAAEIAFGTEVVRGLARRGVPDRHFVIDTSDNGRPFTGAAYHRRHGAHAVLGHAAACRSRSARRCVTLGIPPTTDVANPRWGLSPHLAALAGQHVDAYLWISRPWLHFQTAPFDRARALQLVRTSPF